jgi:hypothetical protein
MRPLKGHPTFVVNGIREQDRQDAEKVLPASFSHRSGPQHTLRARLSSSLAAALPAERCVLAHRVGWVKSLAILSILLTVLNGFQQAARFSRLRRLRPVLQPCGRLLTAP